LRERRACGPLENDEEDLRCQESHSEEQILRTLRQADSGTRVSEICRAYGISDATFYTWKKPDI